MEIDEAGKTTALTDGREIKGAAMRARLRAATEELIAEYGLEAATTVAIARRCNVSRGAMLHHYPTRDDILIDTARHFWRRKRERVEAIAEDVVAGRAGIADFVDRFYEQVFPTQAVLTMLEMMVAGRSDSVLGRAVSDILTDLFRAYEELGERAFAAWSLPPEQIRVVVTLIVCALRGLRMQHILDPNDDTAVAVKQALVEAVQQILTHNQIDARDSDAGLKRRQA